jgi:hypothetical protein
MEPTEPKPISGTSTFLHSCASEASSGTPALNPAELRQQNTRRLRLRLLSHRRQRGDKAAKIAQVFGMLRV